MTGKHKIARRILALVLCAVLVVPMGSTGLAGILSGELRNSMVPTAEAATIKPANDYNSLKAAIDVANTTSEQIIIQLTGSLSGSSVAALPAIQGNVVLDLNGQSISYTYQGSGSDTSNRTYQLPTNNNSSDVLTNNNPTALFTVNEGGTLQIINSAATNSSIYLKTRFELTSGGTSQRTTQTSAHLLNCSGTLILGDVADASKNNFTLKTVSQATNSGSGVGLTRLHSYAVAMTVSLRSSSAVLKMYGGTLLAEANARSNYYAQPVAYCYPLNIENCKSADIYGGTISITDTEGIETGIRNQSDLYNSSDGGTSYFAAIRANSSNVYIFDVSSSVTAYAGSRTKGATLNAANIYSVSGSAPFVIGGQFNNTASASDSNGGSVNSKLVLGNYQRPIRSSGWTAFSDTAAGSYTYYTMFYMADEVTEGNRSANKRVDWYGKYNTVADWVGSGYFDDTYDGHTASFPQTNKDVHFANIDYTTDIEKTLNTFYTRTAYEHNGWRGVIAGSDTPVDIAGGITHTLFDNTGGTVLIHPTWKPTVYRITYDPNGGIYNTLTTPSTEDYTIESTDTMPTPTRDGYTFAGWKPVATVNNWDENKAYPAGTALNGHWGTVTVEAQWQPTVYTVTFDVDGGNAISPLTYNIETGRTLPAAEKTGYTFQSWKVISNDGKHLIAGEYVTSAINPGVFGNITLKAIYTPNNYTLSYNLNGGDGSTPDSKQVTFDAKYETLPIVNRSGYGFDGWYTAATGGEKKTADSVYKIAGDSTLYAQWIANSYSVTFYYNYGTMGQFDSIAVTYDKPYNINSAFGTPVRAGYNFVGWYTEANGGTKVNETDIYKIAGNSFLYAHWEKATYTLTFNSNGGSAVENVTYDIDTPFTIPASTRNGYTLRWVADADAGSWKQGSHYAPGEYLGDYGSVSFTAQWTKIPYTVSLDTAGGTVNPGSVPYDVETAVSLPTPNRAGYQFIRWEVLESVGSFTAGTEVASVAVGNYGNVTLLAIWEPIEYTLTFDLNNGSYDGETVYTYTIEDTLNIIEPTRTAYTFIQWAVKENSGNWIANEYIRTTDAPEGRYGDVTLVAQWQTIQYTMSFNSDGGSTFSNRNYTTLAGLPLPLSVKAGYTFKGWKPDADAGTWQADTIYAAGYEIAGSHGNVAFTAQWEVENYTANLNANGGELEDAAVDYTILSDTVLPTPVRYGYSFDGWKLEATSGSWTDLNKLYSSIEHGNFGDVSLVAQWTLNKYDATFYSQNTLQAGLTVEDYDIENGLTLPEISREHYTFMGWQPAESVGSWDATQIYTAGNYPAAWGTVQFNAVWEVYTYTVEWKNEDGTVLETDENVEYGTVPTYDGATPEKAADAQYTYTFSEWSPVITAVSGANGTIYTYTAVYNAVVNSYTVTWIYDTDENGNRATVTDTFNYGDMPVFNGIPVKASADSSDHVWQFTGWNPALATVTGDATYIAEFTENKNPVTITWMIDGVAYQTYGAPGETPAFYTTPVKADSQGYAYTFTGWSGTENGTVLDKLPVLADGVDVTYYAIFSSDVVYYTATLRANGGTVENDTIAYNIEGSITLPTPTRDGYTFTGWKPANAVGSWDANTAYAAGTLAGQYGEVTLVAQWTATEYTVTVYPADGSAEYGMAYTIDGTQTLPTITREGYTFTGWYVLLGDGSWTQGQVLDLNESLAGSYGDLTVQAQWQINRYTVTWIIDGTSSTETYAYGAAVAQRTAPEKLGYSVAWSVGTLPQTMPAQNLTITAVYTLREYTITYNADGGEMPASYVTQYNITSTEALPVPTKQGSLFAGWLVVSEGGNWVLNTTTATSAVLTGRYGNVSLKAVWTPTIHAITWVVDGVKKIAHWYYGATPSYDGTPVKEADAQYTYTFTGWDKEIVAITGDATYVAQFSTTDRYYTVTWMRDDTVLLEQTYRYGELPDYTGATPQKAPNNLYAYTFSGWSPEIVEVEGPQTYYAQFTVYRFVQSVVLNYSDVTLVNGNTLQLTASVYPIDADYPDVEWFSIDESIATVDSNGFVTAVGVGTTSICVRSLENQELVAFCTVRITPIYVTWLEVTAPGSTTLPVGQTIQLGCILRPDNATNPAVNWVSRDATVAVVGTNGLVTIVGPGTTQIYCYSADGYCTGSVSVTGTQEVVEEPEETYVIVWFPYSAAAGGYIVNGSTIEEGTVKIPYGSDISFKLVNNKDYTVKVDGQGAYYADPNGYYTVHNVTSDISILVFTSGDNLLDDEITNNPQKEKTFFEKLGDFFRRIVEFFRSLFGG